MGFRDPKKNWSFYLHENVALAYVQKQGNKLFKTCRPILISKIYPIQDPKKFEPVYDGLKKAIPNPFKESISVIKG